MHRGRGEKGDLISPLNDFGEPDLPPQNLNFASKHRRNWRGGTGARTPPSVQRGGATPPPVRGGGARGGAGLGHGGAQIVT